ncbi:cytochrome P450 [Streptomyces sp. URMC 126]|uniref:cytochrome P450 n=1 Tax=Streptomyces sp. URMC 126 TaxID=3423401 RepID=UPI003F1D0E17
MTESRATDPLTLPAGDRTCPFSPPPAYEHARSRAPVSRARLWNGDWCRLVTRHEHVREVLSDPRFGADTRLPGFPFLNPARQAMAEHDNRTFINLDGAEHARLRRTILRDFDRRNVLALRPRLQEIADELIDAMTAGRRSADLVAEYALPLPSRVVCLLLGVPYADREFFQRQSRTLMDNSAPPDRVRTAIHTLDRYLIALAHDKRDRPEDGIIGRLAADGMPDRDIAAIGRLLVINGHESTAHTIALSVLVLLRHPDELARLRRDPGLTAGAVDELMRYLTILHQGLTRVATEDVTVGGQRIRAGEGVVCVLGAANRDERAFPDPARFDITRDARRHVAFGHGPHRCLGGFLAEQELQVALETLLRRLPGLRLAVPFSELDFHYDTQAYGVRSLPVRWS